MNKKLLVYVSFFILLFTSVCAATYTVSPTEVWEGSTNVFSLRVNNYLQTPDITDVRVIATGFSVTDAQEYLQWSESAAGSTAHWSGGLISDEVEAARFDFTAQAPAGITGEDNHTFEVTGDDGTYYLTVVVKEDTTAPIFSATNPFDGAYFREGVSDQLITAVVEDPETGVDLVEFSYRDCSANASQTATLVVENDSVTWTTTVDLSSFEEGDDLCFTFRATNNADGESSVSGTAGFDNTPPTITLYTPANDSIISDYTDFVFTCTDNIAPELMYTFALNDADLFGSSITNGENATANMSSANMTEGRHDISITCEDGVGLTATLEQTYTVDRTAPVITLTNPLAPNTFIGDNQLITAQATDTHNASITSYSVERNTSSHAEGVLSFTVTAEDEAGNVAVTPFDITIDKTAPTVDIISPAEDAEVDGAHAYINVTDNFMNQSATCTVATPTGEDNHDTFPMGIAHNVSVPGAPLGPTLLSIICEDQAGNSVETTRNVVVIDTSGPSISTEITYLVRSQANTITADIIDVSGVDSASLQIFDSDRSMSLLTNNTYTASITPDISLALGAYTLNFTAEDSLGWVSTLSTEVELVVGYDMDYRITSDTPRSGDSITISGRVRYDDGTTIDEEEGILTLYDGTNVTVTFDADGDFSYATTAPTELGDFSVTLTIYSDNGYTYTEEAEARVVSGSSDSSSSSGGRRSSSRDSSSSDDSNSGSTESTSTTTSTDSDAETTSRPSLTPTGSDDTNTDSGEEVSLAPRSTSPVGVGQASGVFNLQFLKANWWILLLLVAAIAGLAALAYYKKGDGEEPKEAD